MLLFYFFVRFFVFSCFFFFFFSSRRRHTRCLSDWSSDVCSSDLIPHFLSASLASWIPPQGFGDLLWPRMRTRSFGRGDDEPSVWRSGVRCRAARSEERRVGKECRSRWWPEH